MLCPDDEIIHILLLWPAMSGRVYAMSTGQPPRRTQCTEKPCTLESALTYRDEEHDKTVYGFLEANIKF